MLITENIPLSLRAEDVSGRKTEHPLTNSASCRTACVFLIHVHVVTVLALDTGHWSWPHAF